MPWDPDRYHQFQRERSAPFEDLLALVKRRTGLHAIDLGCGTGELTRRLTDALPASEVIGVDRSPEMLRRAASQARPNLRFEQGDIEAEVRPWDLIFSHAALQWVPDHPRLIPRLLSLLRPGGQLAVQVPSNHGHQAHILIHEVAGEEPFRSALGGWQRHSPVLAIDTYAEILFAHGAIELTVFEKVYAHLLENADAVADWTSGTALVPYFERLPHELHEPFMREYRARLAALWPSGPVFYPFRRTLFAATLP